jgi:hypothetical protein
MAGIAITRQELTATELRAAAGKTKARVRRGGCLYSESPRSSCRENSTYAAPYFRGGLPL